MYLIFIIATISIELVVSTQVHAPIEYIGKTPYHVSIRNADGKHICSGAIIKQNLILASGHCNSHSAAYIVAGSEFSDTNATEYTQTLKITKNLPLIGIRGERYMILFTLESNLKYGYGIEPIRISLEEPTSGSLARTSGFTKIENGQKRLHSVELKISKAEDCQASFNHPMYFSKVTCTTASTIEEMCLATERTSLLVCHRNGLELCGLSFVPISYDCETNTVLRNTDQLLTGFVKFVDFENWLKSNNAL